MKSNYISYDFEKSRSRIVEILDSSDYSFSEVNSIPERDKLTYTNGFYVNCTALFIDIRESSKLPQRYKRPSLAKLYKSYLSEAIAVINGNLDCAEINVHGDCVWGVFNTPYQRDINSVFSTAARLSSVIDVLNCQLEKRKMDAISVGIGMDYGRALMIKAGYNGSGINDVVWMGDVINSACKLSSYGNQSYLDQELMVSEVIYQNLVPENQQLLKWNSTRHCYQGDIVNVEMNEWLKN